MNVKLSKLKIPIKLQVILRSTLGIKKYPVGIDSKGLLYYDGVVRKVVDPKSQSQVSYPSVRYSYSKWLNYEIVNFPEKTNEHYYFELHPNRDFLVKSLKITNKELDREKMVYNQAYFVLRFGKFY